MLKSETNSEIVRAIENLEEARIAYDRAYERVNVLGKKLADAVDCYEQQVPRNVLDAYAQIKGLDVRHEQRDGYGMMAVVDGDVKLFAYTWEVE